eukprot:1195080-Prorocentrum_minimum.AAC.2
MLWLGRLGCEQALHVHVCSGPVQLLRGSTHAHEAEVLPFIQRPSQSPLGRRPRPHPPHPLRPPCTPIRRLRPPVVTPPPPWTRREVLQWRCREETVYSIHSRQGPRHQPCRGEITLSARGGGNPTHCVEAPGRGK